MGDLPVWVAVLATILGALGAGAVTPKLVEAWRAPRAKELDDQAAFQQRVLADNDQLRAQVERLQKRLDGEREVAFQKQVALQAEVLNLQAQVSSQADQITDQRRETTQLSTEVQRLRTLLEGKACPDCPYSLSEVIARRRSQDTVEAAKP